MSESFEHMGLTIKIKQDSDYDSPREWDNVGRMVCWHRRYKLGDEHHYDDPDEFFLSILLDLELSKDEINKILSSLLTEDELKEDYREAYLHHGGQSKDDIRNDFVINTLNGYYFEPSKATKEVIMKILDEHYVILPLYLYDHSGITMNTTGFTCRWDSGQVGYIYMSMDEAEKEFEAMLKHRQEHPEWFGDEKPPTAAEEWASERLKCEVKTYDQYLTGDVWGYVIEDEDGNELESCWSFYGEDYCIEAAKEVAEGIAKTLSHDYQI